MTLKQSATHYKQKITTIFRYKTTNFMKTLYLFLVSKKVEIKGKNEFETKFVGIIVMISSI